jgi:hypothetical protein
MSIQSLKVYELQLCPAQDYMGMFLLSPVERVYICINHWLHGAEPVLTERPPIE